VNKKGISVKGKHRKISVPTRPIFLLKKNKKKKRGARISGEERGGGNSARRAQHVLEKSIGGERKMLLR